MFIGPFEHHSNELPWRESIADVVDDPARTPTGTSTSTELRAAARRVRRPAAEDRLVLAPPRNVTGIVTDTYAHLRRCCTEHGALSFWDFAAAAPVRRHRDVPPTCASTRGAYKDAIFLSPHKFIGGPARPACSSSRRELLHQPGARRARRRHRRLRQPRRARATSTDPAHREEGGTPAIIESIRAGLVFQLKEAVGRRRRSGRTRSDFLRARRRGLARRARPSRSSATSTPSGCRSSRSWCARPCGRYLHHNFVVALLNDLFGIQSRGGCSCAGPYGHRLLGIDLERSHEFEREITARLRGHQARLGAGQLQLLHLRRGRSTTSSRPCGWSRATAGGCCGDYRFDPATGLLAPPRRAGRAAAAAAPRCATTPTARCATRAHDDRAPRGGAGRLPRRRRGELLRDVPQPTCSSRHGRPRVRRLRAAALVRAAAATASSRRH